MSDDGRHSVAVSVVVFDDQDQILLMKRRDHRNWEPPGGVLKLGEDPREGARREVEEETGLTAEIGRLTGVYANVEEGVISIVFRGEARSPAAGESDEASAVRWFAADEAGRVLHEEYRDWIRDALNDDVATVRTQRQTVKGASESPDR